MVPTDPQSRVWHVGQEKQVPLPAVMAILNATPDSFYGPSRGPTVESALKAVRDGAAILDIGAESTRPGAEPIPPEEQVRRAAPLIRAVRQQGCTAAITIDTTSSVVARAALDAGADAINDVSAGLDDPRMLTLAAERRCGIVLMHRLNAPANDRYSDRYAETKPVYADVVREVGEFLRRRADAAIEAGVARECIVLDPGLGFGKTVEQNLELIRRTGEIAALGYPVLSGLSRKSFVGRASLGRDSTPEERLAGTLTFSAQHFLAGASIFRVHDVEDNVAALVAAGAVFLH